MAYVSISTDLLNRVEKKIIGMQNQEISASCPSLNNSFTNTDASHLYNMGCWGADNLHLMNAIPKDWLSKTEEASIRVWGTVDIEGDPVPRRIHKDVYFKGMSSAYHRPSRSYYDRSTSELEYTSVLAMPENVVGRNELVERFEMAQVEAQIKARWEKINKDMTEFLRKCKSLNEAIKLFPAVKMYVDADDIERLERKIVRAPREDLVKDMDTGAITAAAIAARLTAGAEA